MGAGCDIRSDSHGPLQHHVGVDIGFALPVSGSWATPDNVVEIAETAERLGYTTLWTYQRLLYPEGTKLSSVYESVLDPVTVLGFAAAVTTRIRLGTAIVNLPFQSPVVLGKQFATLDVLSKGRLEAGLGLGWAQEEFTAADAEYTRRGARGDEFIAAIRAVWGPDPVEFDGGFYTIPRSKILPKPVQQPHPPIFIGGIAKPALDRTGRLADGWISSSGADLSTLADPIERVRSAARAAGRDPDALRFVCRGVIRDTNRNGPLTGTPEQIRADLPDLAAQGMTETFLDLNFDPTIGNPRADPAQSMRRAREILEGLAPA